MLRLFFRYIKSQRVAIFKTLLINFKCLPFKQAMKFPIHVYSGTILKSIGRIVIDSPIKRGMVKIGKDRHFAANKFRLINAGQIIFRGECILDAGTCINNSGLIDIGKGVILCENMTIMIVNRLLIGDFSRITFGCVVMDTNYHSVVNLNNGAIKIAYAPVQIGAYAWIGNRSTIMKGTIIPDFTITASTSFLNKDYTTIAPYSLLAGSPAKVVATGIRRIYNDSNNQIVDEYFMMNKNQKEFVIDVTRIDSWDEFCLPNK